MWWRLVKILLVAPLKHQVELIKSTGRRGEKQVIRCTVVRTAKQTVTLPQRQTVRQAITQPFRKGQLITEGFPVQASGTGWSERHVSKRLSSCGLQSSGQRLPAVTQRPRVDAAVFTGCV